MCRTYILIGSGRLAIYKYNFTIYHAINNESNNQIWQIKKRIFYPGSNILLTDIILPYLLPHNTMLFRRPFGICFSF